VSVAPKPAVSVAEALAAAAQDIETAADALLTWPTTARLD
jgi:hypothetical protein